MLYEANRQTQTITKTPLKKFDTKTTRCFNADVFSKNEYSKAKRFLDGEEVSTKYKNAFSPICKSEIKVFFDLEFIRPYDNILAIGFCVTKNEKLIQSFLSYIKPQSKFSDNVYVYCHLDKEKVLSGQEYGKVMEKAGEILMPYKNAQCFVWGMEDKKICSRKKGITAKMIAGATDLQSVVKRKFSVPDISLSNALRCTSFSYEHNYNPYEDAIGLFELYKFAEGLDKSFIKGLFEFTKYYSLKNSVETYKALNKNKTIYEDRIKMLSSKKRNRVENEIYERSREKLKRLKELKENLGDVSAVESMLKESIFA